jgi:heat shock protein HslJ
VRSAPLLVVAGFGALLHPVSAGDNVLIGTAWQLEAPSNASVQAERRETLAFPQPDRAAGRTACNGFVAEARVSGERLSIRIVSTTQMACTPPRDVHEARYLEALSAAQRFAVEGDTLRIYQRGEEAVLRFSRLRASPTDARGPETEHRP